jgi:hypothetical protein
LANRFDLGILRVADCGHPMPACFQTDGEHLPDIGFIVDNEDIKRMFRLIVIQHISPSFF